MLNLEKFLNIESCISLNLSYSFFFKKYELLKWIFQTVIYDLNESNEIASNIKFKIFNVR